MILESSGIEQSSNDNGQASSTDTQFHGLSSSSTSPSKVSLFETKNHQINNNEEKARSLKSSPPNLPLLVTSTSSPQTAKNSSTLIDIKKRDMPKSPLQHRNSDVSRSHKNINPPSAFKRMESDVSVQRAKILAKELKVAKKEREGKDKKAATVDSIINTEKEKQKGKESELPQWVQDRKTGLSRDHAPILLFCSCPLT